jgi:hypothetical protein
MPKWSSCTRPPWATGGLEMGYTALDAQASVSKHSLTSGCRRVLPARRQSMGSSVLVSSCLLGLTDTSSRWPMFRVPDVST